MASKLIQAAKASKAKTLTFNGAKTRNTTGNGVVDFYAQSAAMRGQDVIPLFAEAYAEERELAVLAAFQLRDCRGGRGERQLFRNILVYLADNDPDTFLKVFKFVPEYGRWDDLFVVAKHETVGKSVVNFILNQLKTDSEAKNPSILAKHMPSNNASSRHTKEMAAFFTNELGFTPKQYRKLLSNLRSRIGVVEVFMSANKWSEINYPSVSSGAMLRYRKAFPKRDADRFAKYIESVKNGTQKINASTLFPYEIMYNVRKSYSVDKTLEAQWKALPNYLEGDNSNSLVVVDSSASMEDWNFYGRVSNAPRSFTPFDVAMSLGIYMAERNRGLFANHVLSFSEKSEIYKIKGNSLKEKVDNIGRKIMTDRSTNLQSVFNLILSLAIKHKLPEEEMPKRIFIISDMEFDQGTSGRTNHNEMRDKYKAAGYEIPLIVYWNVNSHQRNVPVKQDKDGVFLVSGCSASDFKSALSQKATTPRELVEEVLNSQRYAPVREALSN